MLVGLLIYGFISGIAVYSFLKRKYVRFLMAYLALLTNIYMLDRYTGFEYGKDLAIAANYILLLYLLISKIKIDYCRYGKKTLRISKSFFKDPGFIIISVWSGFYLFEFLRTVVLGFETPSFAYKVTRLPQLLLIYFPLQSVPLSDVKKFFNICYRITIGLSFLFLLQFVGINLLVGKPDVSNFDISYANNLPFWLIPYFFYVVLFKKGNKKILVGLLFITCIFLTYVRSSIICLFFCLAVSVAKNWHKKSAKILALLCCIVFPIGISVVSVKSDASGSNVKEDISALLSLNYNHYTAAHNGTFSFRILMLAERVDYLLQNKRYLQLGVGAVHEDSPSGGQFNFLIGTINDDKPSGRCTIESGDITWVPIVLRYGLIGTIIHLFFLIFPIFFLRKRKDALFVLYIVFVYHTIISFATTYFERELIYFEYSLFLAILYSERKWKKTNIPQL